MRGVVVAMLETILTLACQKVRVISCCERSSALDNDRKNQGVL